MTDGALTGQVDARQIQERLATVEDPVAFLINLFAHAPLGLAVWNASGQTLLTNRAFFELFHSVPPREYNVLEDELLAANGMLPLFQRAFAGETVHVPTFWYDPRDLKSLGVTEGRRVAISMTIFPLFKSSGAIDYVAATYKDETELSLVAERLGVSEDRQRLAHQTARAGTFELNMQTGENRWTPEIEALYGLEPGEFGRTLRSWEALVHPDDRVAAVALVEEAIEAAAPVEGQWRVVWRDGSLHWLFARFQVLRDEEGKPHRLIGVNVDITRRTVADARLRTLTEVSTVLATNVTDYQQLLDRIVRVTADLIGDGCMVSLLDPDGETLVNAASAHRDRLLQADLESYGASKTTSKTVSAEVLRTGKPRLIAEIKPEALAQSLEESVRPMVLRLNVHSAVVVPIRSRDKVIGTIALERSVPGQAYDTQDLALLEDLAHRAGLAIENARLYAELDQRVVERTAALEEANRELETFSYTVAHDLRAPLRAMNGFSSILLEDHASQLDDEGRKHLELIRVSATRMADIIAALLALAKLSRATVVRARVDLTALAHAVVEHLRRADPQRTVDVMIEPEMTANGDLHLLRVLLDNLLGNAWKFTSRQAGARIDFGCTRAGGLDHFFIRDNGAGFDMKYSGKLFMPFQRLHTGAEFEGTGIGLATVQRIIRQHGGTITATGQKGEGATFVFTLDPSSRPPTMTRRR